MNGRIWYPQLDVYDAVRRMALLLHAWHATSPVLERLYIADFFLANPPLLHRTNMPRPIRNEFGSLDISRPEKTFLSYPNAPLLFQKMAPIQKKAFQTLVGRGITSPEGARQGNAVLSSFGTQFVKEDVLKGASEWELKLVEFLATQFIVLGDDGTREIRQRTGLRRPV